MGEPLKISELTLMQIADRQQLSAKVDGELVWFDFPSSIELEARGELFIAVALLEAMVSNKAIELGDDIVISPTLLRRIDTLQNIYSCWNKDLKKIAIKGGVIRASVGNNLVGCFYSGGVDGAYSFCQHQREVTHLITLAGFDLVNNQTQWRNLVAKNKLFAKKYNIALVDVNSNVRQFSEKRKISIYFQHGLTLAGIAISLGFGKTYIPTGLTYDDLFPWSSHPLTDHLWSIEERDVIHDGVEMSRSSKIKFLADYPEALDNLQVCWGNIDHNCGQCSKCIRTRAALHLIKVSCASLAPIVDIKELNKITISGTSGLPVIKDLLNLAHIHHCDDEVKIFKRITRRYLIKLHTEELIKSILGPKITRYIARLRGGLWKEYRVTMEGKDE